MKLKRPEHSVKKARSPGSSETAINITMTYTALATMNTDATTSPRLMWRAKGRKEGGRELKNVIIIRCGFC